MENENPEEIKNQTAIQAVFSFSHIIYNLPDTRVSVLEFVHFTLGVYEGEILVFL